MEYTGQDVLIVDDEPELREALQDLLELEGYAVHCAGDGAEALEHVKATRPRLIILDLMMPRMNGYEFMAELERHDLRQDIPILVLSADKSAQDKAIRIGANTGIAKPFDANTLLDEVARLTR